MRHAYERQVAPLLTRVGECIEFTGCMNATGYGVVKVGGRKGRVMLCHRVTYEALVGPIPKGQVVMHLCDNPACCNIEHLRVGTQADNLADMHRKGRATGGPLSRLTADEIMELRRMHEDGLSTRAIAARTKVSKSQVAVLLHTMPRRLRCA